MRAGSSVVGRAAETRKRMPIPIVATSDATRISFPLAGDRVVVDAPVPAAFEAALAATGLR